MMKARRSASNCGASAQVPERENGREAVVSQLSGLPHTRARAPAGGTGPGTHLQDGAHGVGPMYSLEVLLSRFGTSLFFHVQF